MLTALLVVFGIIQIFVIAVVRMHGMVDLWDLKWRIATLVCLAVIYFCK